MKNRLSAVLFLIFTPLTLIVAIGLHAQPAAPDVIASGDPIRVDLALGDNPLSLDPSMATDSTSTAVVEQLFVGLVTQDDLTAEIRPELATSWQISDDRMVYTFTLRSDAVWSDGRQIKASDVRYGILRSLAPDTGYYPYPLWIIKNGEAYSSGNVSADQVGLDVISDTILRVRLEDPAGHALAIFSLWNARPLPKWAIDAHGDNWTSPDHIVSSGPYLLSEYTSGDHIALSKNPKFYGAAGVQIEQAIMWIIGDGNVAWQKYLDDELDTVAVPTGAEIPPEVADEIVKKPAPCTYYYGFSESQPPFDQPLVRKAFSAATDRQAVVDTLIEGTAPALTFTPRGLFGHVDGYAEGIGHPYNPTQAQQYLSDAGYPNGTGLPAVTLWFNAGSGHQAIAELIRDQWQTVLNVTVGLESQPWDEYLGMVDSGNLQVWRMSWCADYLDAYNFLGDGMNSRGRHGGWQNATYDNLIDQSRTEVDQTARAALFKQAEEILVETDAIMIPIYYYGSQIASKPHLDRTYPATNYHIAFWRIRTAEIMDGDGGSFASYDGQTVITLPAGTLTGTAELIQAPVSGPPDSGESLIVGKAFEITAVYSDTGKPVTPQNPYEIEFHYTTASKGPVIESTLAFYYWDGAHWQQEPSSALDAANNKVTAAPDHFSVWAVMGETNRLYLPVVIR